MDKPITLILDCPKTGRTVIAHMSEDDFDKFLDSCACEQKAGLMDIVKESEPQIPEPELSEIEKYYYRHE